MHSSAHVPAFLERLPEIQIPQLRRFPSEGRGAGGLPGSPRGNPLMSGPRPFHAGWADENPGQGTRGRPMRISIPPPGMDRPASAGPGTPRNALPSSMDMPASSASTPAGGTGREGTALLQDAEAERMAAAGQSRTRQEPSLAESSVLSSQPRFFGKNGAGSAAPGRPGADRSGGALTGLYRPPVSGAGRVLCLPEQIFPGKSRDSPQMSWLTVHFPGWQSRIRKWEHCGHGTPVQHPASVPPPEMAE